MYESVEIGLVPGRGDGLHSFGSGTSAFEPDDERMSSIDPFPIALSDSIPAGRRFKGALLEEEADGAQPKHMLPSQEDGCCFPIQMLCEQFGDGYVRRIGDVVKSS